MDVLKPGNYTAEVTYNGDDEYTIFTNNTEFTIAKVYEYGIIPKMSDIEVGDNATLIVYLPNGAEGNVITTIGGKKYNATICDGIATINNISGLTVGVYNINITYGGNDIYESKTVKCNFTLSKCSDYDMNVTIPEKIKIGEDIIVTVDLPGDATGNVTVIIGTQNHTSEVKNSTTTIKIPGLSVGDYNVTIRYCGDDKYAPANINKTVTVFLNDVKLIANDVVMIYNDSSRLYARLLDSNDNPIPDTLLSFTINGVTYNKMTNERGMASIALNLDCGVYNAVISYAGKQYDSSSVNVTVDIKSSIIADNLVKMYQNDTRFSAKFLDGSGKALANTNIEFNINGVFYKCQTNENGTARLSINLRLGNYTLTAYNPFNGEQRRFNILVKSLIETRDLTKYYLNASKFEGKIYNKDGSLAINKNVIFNINGVFYTHNR